MVLFNNFIKYHDFQSFFIKIMPFLLNYHLFFKKSRIKNELFCDKTISKNY